MVIKAGFWLNPNDKSTHDLPDPKKFIDKAWRQSKPGQEFMRALMLVEGYYMLKYHAMLVDEDRLDKIWDKERADGVIPDDRTKSPYRGSGWLKVPTVAYMGSSDCRICGVTNGNLEFDKQNTAQWPEGFRHYIKAHDVRPEQDFVDFILQEAEVIRASVVPEFYEDLQ